MSYQVRILPVVSQDIRESIAWYNNQKKGLGKHFYAAVKSRIDYIRRNPQHYQTRYRNIRQAEVNKYPYLIHYIVEEDKKQVIVLGVIHTSRAPETWEKRI